MSDWNDVKDLLPEEDGVVVVVKTTSHTKPVMSKRKREKWYFVNPLKPYTMCAMPWIVTKWRCME